MLCDNCRRDHKAPIDYEASRDWRPPVPYQETRGMLRTMVLSVGAMVGGLCLLAHWMGWLP